MGSPRARCRKSKSFEQPLEDWWFRADRGGVEALVFEFIENECNAGLCDPLQVLFRHADQRVEPVSIVAPLARRVGGGTGEVKPVLFRHVQVVVALVSWTNRLLSTIWERHSQSGDAFRDLWVVREKLVERCVSPPWDIEFDEEVAK